MKTSHILVIGLLLCACGSSSATGASLGKMPTRLPSDPDLDLHIVDINPTALKSSGDHQHDSPENVESRYFWSAEPVWGAINRIAPKRGPVEWERRTTNDPIVAIYRVTTAKRFFFKIGETTTCYSTSLHLSQSTTTDADRDPAALTTSKVVGAFASRNLTESEEKTEVSCDGFDQLRNIDRTP